MESNDVKQKNQISKSFYIGFIGKVIGSILFFVTLLIILPILNGGVVPNFQDVISWRYADPTFTARLKYFLFNLTFVFGPAGLAFESMMFVHASLKDSVFGIDQNLRKAFRNAVFTGMGAFLFILSSEIMENLLGYGIFGGVFLGISFLIVRKPVLKIIDGFSGQILPDSHTPEEIGYLELYAMAKQDGKITESERSMLNLQAKTYSIQPERMTILENWYDSESSQGTINLSERFGTEGINLMSVFGLSNDAPLSIEDIKMAISELDGDGDLALSRDEFSSASSLSSLTLQQRNELFDLIDQNSDGSIQFSEFLMAAQMAEFENINTDELPLEE